MALKHEASASDASQHGGAHHCHVVEIFLPVLRSDGTAMPKAMFDEVRDELTDLFGGVTAHLRAPAAGAWRDQDGKVERDDVVLLEVMTSALDQRWWARYRVRLEQRFEQQEIMIRATSVERL